MAEAAYYGKQQVPDWLGRQPTMRDLHVFVAALHEVVMNDRKVNPLEMAPDV